MRFEIKGRVIQQNRTMLGTQGENNIEEIEFVIPKIVGNADLSAAGTQCILYCITSNKQKFEKILDFSELDDTTMLVKWSVGRDETQSVGILYTAIHFSTVFDNVLKTEISMFEVKSTINIESPQPMIFSSRRANFAVQPEIEAIRVSNNKFIIPAAFQNIAVQNDNESKIILIKMPRIYSGQDLSLYPIKLHVETSGGSEWIPFIPQVQEDEITLLWTVQRPHTSYAGSIRIQLEIGTDSTDTFFKQTEISTLNVLPSLGDEPIVPISPPEFVSYLAQMDALKMQAISAKDISVTKAEEASSSALSAASSASSAATSAGKAKSSEENAKKSETGAAGSLTDIESGLVSRLSISEANQLFKNITIDDDTGIFTFTRYDNTKLTIDTGLEKVVLNMRVDPDTLDLVLLLADGTEQRVSLVPFLNLYEGGDTGTIQVMVNGTVITAAIKGNSISFNLLTSEFQEIINNKVTANQTGNASQVKFSDGYTMQQKLDAGDLNGKDGLAIEQSGLFYMRVDEFGHLKVGVPDLVEPPPLSIRNGKLIYTIS